jgi:hypothetical protein
MTTGEVEKLATKYGKVDPGQTQTSATVVI